MACIHMCLLLIPRISQTLTERHLLFFADAAPEAPRWGEGGPEDLLLLAVQESLKSLLQHHSSKASILQCSTFFMVQLSHPYMTTEKP